MANSMTIHQAIHKYDDTEFLRYLNEEIKMKGNDKEVMQTLYPDDTEIDLRCSLLQLALKLNKSDDVVFKLIDIGGKELVMMRNSVGFTPLQDACQNKKASINIISKLIEVGGREMVMAKEGYYGQSALHFACGNTNISLSIISKLIEVGGQELVMMIDSYNESALHLACRNLNVSLDVVTKLIEIGGRELVMMKNSVGTTSLHDACHNKSAPIDIISKLIEVGELELVMSHSKYSGTALHFVCNYNISLDVVSKLIEVGGRKLVMEKTNYYKYEGTALHCACRHINVSLDIVSKLIEVGGRELVMMNDDVGNTSLHGACQNRTIPLDVISKLIEVGKRELLLKKNDNGDIALHSGYFVQSSRHNKNYNDRFALLVKTCMLANIGGEFGIGGLFNIARQEVQDEIYERWEDILPPLKSAIESLQEQKPPILHAAILVKAPSNVIQGVIKHFEYSVLKADSLNRYPIQVALEEGLGWSEGLQEVIEATALAHQHGSSIYTAAQYGLKWKPYMKELAQASVDEIMGGYNSLTGLSLFMSAAMGDCNDLSAIYGLMRMSPEHTRTYFDGCMKKRRRLK